MAQVSLQYVDKVIIVPNKGKPFRSDLSHRVNIIKLSIRNNPNISVTDEDIDTLNDRLYKQKYLAGLIGADKCNKEPKLKVHEWLVVPRAGYELPKTNWTVPVTNMSEILFHHE